MRVLVFSLYLIIIQYKGNSFKISNSNIYVPWIVKKDVTFLNSISLDMYHRSLSILEHFGIGILVMIGLSTTRIKEGAIHFESNHLNDSTVECLSSLIIAEHSRYKPSLFHPVILHLN